MIWRFLMGSRRAEPSPTPTVDVVEIERRVSDAIGMPVRVDFVQGGLALEIWVDPVDPVVIGEDDERRIANRFIFRLLRRFRRF